MRLRVSILAALMATMSTPVKAYPIDCAIILCLAGGFPPSAECTAAKATMLRRAAPFPIEPPIQPWRCPMGQGPARAITLSTYWDGQDHVPSPRSWLARNGLTSLVQSRFYYVDFAHNENKRGDCNVYNKSTISWIDDDGNFVTQYMHPEDFPAWLHIPIDCDDDYSRRHFVAHETYAHDGRRSQHIEYIRQH